MPGLEEYCSDALKREFSDSPRLGTHFPAPEDASCCAAVVPALLRQDYTHKRIQIPLASRPDRSVVYSRFQPALPQKAIIGLNQHQP